MVTEEVTTVVFFRNALAEALAKERVSVDPLAEQYVATLLVRNVAFGHDPSETISDRYAMALSADKGLRKNLLIEVGDMALIFSGLWWEYHHGPRRVSHADLYMELGPRAYRLIGGSTFEELSRKFDGLVSALVRIGLDHSMVHVRDILRLYELWHETGDSRIAKVLAAHGIFVSKSYNRPPS